MSHPPPSEELALVLIDEQLTRAGWYVCDRKDINLVNHRGNAVREVIVKLDHSQFETKDEK